MKTILAGLLSLVAFVWGLDLFAAPAASGASLWWTIRQEGLYLTGLSSIVMMSVAMILATRPVWLERPLGGMDRYGLEPSLVEIELTESTMRRNAVAVGNALDSLQRTGIKLLVDDFGTSYSSLSQLQRLDFDVLKVDRSFTAELNKSVEGTTLFRAIITMAHELNMRVVAEGVETVEQLRTLASLHCDEIQGFLVSRPLPPSQTQEELLREFPVAV